MTKLTINLSVTDVPNKKIEKHRFKNWPVCQSCIKTGYESTGKPHSIGQNIILVYKMSARSSQIIFRYCFYLLRHHIYFVIYTFIKYKK